MMGTWKSGCTTIILTFASLRIISYRGIDEKHSQLTVKTYSVALRLLDLALNQVFDPHGEVPIREFPREICHNLVSVLSVSGT